MFWWGTQKFWINATWIWIFSLSPWLHATPLDWNIFPSTCITDKPGELCRLEITVEFPPSLEKMAIEEQHLQNQTQQVCFELNDAPLDCLPIARSRVKLPIEITKTSLLKVLVNDEPVLEKEIVVQSLAPNKKRRRVRNPWSFF